MTRSSWRLPPALGALLLAPLMLVGCASIPLGTAVGLSALTPRDLARIDPAGVEVRVFIPEDFTLDVPASRLRLSLAGAQRSKTAEMMLDVVATSRSVRDDGLFSTGVPVRSYLLKLNKDGARELRSMQQFVLANEPREFAFGFNVPFADVPDDARAVVFWVDLKLSDERGFMPLIDGAELRFKQGGV